MQGSMMQLINKILAKVNLQVVKRNKLIMLEKSAKQISDQKKLHIAVFLIGGIGDMLIALAWIKELYKTMPYPIQFDIFSKKIRLKNIKMLTRGHCHIAGIYPDSMYKMAQGYDAKIRIFHSIKVEEYSVGKIKQKCPPLLDVIRKVQEFTTRYEKRYFSSTPMHGAWANLCMLKGWNRWDELGVNQAIPFSQKTKAFFSIAPDALAVLDKFGLRDRPFVTIHRGVDKDFSGTEGGPRESAIKIMPRRNIEEFCRLFKQQFPHILLVQIGTDLPLRVDGTDLCLISQTSLEEAAVLLKHALVHVDGESGFGHLRMQLGARSVIIFGPTPMEYFAYPENCNIASPFCNNCMWTEDGWQTSCARGFSGPKCLESVTPESIVEGARSLLDHMHDYAYSAGKHNICTLAEQKFPEYEPLLEDIRGCCAPEKNRVGNDFLGDSAHGLNRAHVWEQLFQADWLQKNVPPPQLVAFAGGGTLLPWYLTQKGYTVAEYAIASPGQPSSPQHSHIRFAIENGFSVEFGDNYNIPAESESFDIVCRQSSLLHIPEKYFAIKEMFRILKPGGTLLCTLTVASSEQWRGYSDFIASLKEFGVSDIPFEAKNGIQQYLLQEEKTACPPLHVGLTLVKHSRKTAPFS